MVKFTIDQVREIMKQQNNIRNISVIAHVDHGKSTLTDSLIKKAGISTEDRFMDTLKEEKDRGITIKSTGVSLYYEYQRESLEAEKYLVNLIDSPGHVDFSSEVTAALRVTDGALVVVDYIEGARVQTETVLRQALTELIKPVLMINKVDRAFYETRDDPETIYQRFQKVVEDVNVVISTYQNIELMESCEVDPRNGSVAFGSAKQGWGFTLHTFARMYAKKTNQDENKILEKLWGDNFVDPKTNKWYTTKHLEGREEPLERGFCRLVLKPILELVRAIESNQTDTYEEIITKKLKLELDVDSALQAKTKGKFTEFVLSNWIDASDALLDMITSHLPSPVIAQRYRTQYLYEGSMDDECAQAMMKCDPNGPVMMFVSKMIPSGESGRFTAFGRVFSGTVTSGAKVRILGPNFKHGSKTDLFEKNIQKVILWMAKKVEDIGEAQCGNTCGLVGIDQCLVKQGTISDSLIASTIKCMKYSVSPIVRMAVKPKNPSEMDKFIIGLKKMVNADPVVQVIDNKTEIIVAGCGELHLEINLNDLSEKYCGDTKLEIIKSNPIVPYTETVMSASTKDVMAKSANKHNRAFMNAEPLGEELTKAIEDETLKYRDSPKEFAKTLVQEYSWDNQDAKKIWCFGPENKGPNILVDKTSQVQYLNEVRDTMESSFQWSTNEGVLAEERVRGVRYNILDAQLHRDSAHRSVSQIMPMARRLYYASQLVSEPRYQEPMYLVTINCPSSVSSKIYGIFSLKRGVIFEEEEIFGTPQVVIKGYLPVSESFGFNEQLKTQTSGQAFPTTIFDHWELVNSDPFDVKGRAYNITLETRKRKGLKVELPVLSDYADKE